MLLQQLTKFLSWAKSRQPQNKTQLNQLLKTCAARNIIDYKSLTMIEGVLQTSDMQARDIIIPRAQMVCVNASDNPLDYIKIIQECFSYERAAKSDVTSK